MKFVEPHTFADPDAAARTYVRFTDSGAALFA